MMSKPVQQLQLTLFECGRPLKRARRDSESASTDSTPPTQFTLQPSSQVCNTTEHMCMMTEPAVSSASSFAAYSSPAYSCPTPEFISRSSDEESVISVAEFSGGSESSKHGVLSHHANSATHKQAEVSMASVPEKPTTWYKHIRLY